MDACTVAENVKTDPQPARAIRELEGRIVRQCSPTLAGLKPASLFTVPGAFAPDARGTRGHHDASDGSTAAAARERLRATMRACDAKLAPAGIRVRILVWRPCGALIYVYRRTHLADYLSNPRARTPLARAGYPVHDLDACLMRLARRIAAASDKAPCTAECPAACAEPSVHLAGTAACTEGFPHEMGYFLGYPYADVEGFILHKGKDYVAMGLWKVYGERERALETFARYKRCTRELERAYRRHGELRRLAACA